MTAEPIIEGEVREERGLVRRPVSAVEAAGTTALAEMSDTEFEARLIQIKRGRERVDRIHKELMREGVDYGVIPGTKNPTLLKPGAEILCQAYKLVPEFVLDHQYGDGEARPDLRVVSRCLLHLGSLDGPVVGDGNGAANSWETRYRYRQGERKCPTCHKSGSVIKGKDEYGGGWLCYRKKGGCGAKFDDGDERIESQEVGQIENPDPYDLDVTLVKMSEKRSQVDATLRALAISGLFTQDVEDMDVGGRRDSRRAASSHDDHGPRRRQGPQRVTLTGTVEPEEGDGQPRQYPQGWAVLYHIATEDGPTRVIVTRDKQEDLPTLAAGDRVRIEGEWQPRQNALVTHEVKLAVDASAESAAPALDDAFSVE